MHPIAARGVWLLNALPTHSHFRSILLSLLLRDLPVPQAAQLTSTSQSTVKQAMARYREGEVGELEQIYAAGVTRQRIPEVELSAIRDFITQNCPAKSGTPREHYVQLLTSDELYAKYQAGYLRLLQNVIDASKAAPDSANLKPPEPALQTLLQKVQLHQQGLAFLAALQSPSSEPAAVRAFAGGVLPGPAQIVVDYLLESMSVPPSARSRAMFDSVKHTLPLSHPHRYYGEFDCPICANGTANQGVVERLSSRQSLSEDEKKQFDEAKKKADKYEWHLKVLPSQRAEIDNVIDNLVDPSHALALLDFGTYHPHPNVGDKDKVPYTSLAIVVETTRGREYIDVLCNDKTTQKGDYHYLRAALLLLFQHTSIFLSINTITFISDTSSKQFRSRFVWPLMGALGKHCGKTLRLLYRCERHGHSLCDSHLGIVSQTITRYLNKMQHERRTGSEPAAAKLSPLSDARVLAEMLKQKFTEGEHKQKYSCFVLDTVDRSAELKPDTRKVSGVMKQHDVVCESPVKLRLRQLSSDPNYDVLHLQITKSWSLLADSERFGGGEYLMCGFAVFSRFLQTVLRQRRLARLRRQRLALRLAVSVRLLR